MILHEERLNQVAPALATVVRLAGERTSFVILEGARSVEDEQKAIDTGHSKLKDPMNSKHVIGPSRPLALAVDLAPLPVNWSDLDAFRQLSTVVLSCASEVGTVVTWGGDWTTLRDYPHYELP